MAHLIQSNSAAGNNFSNLRTIERCLKRFQEKYVNPIAIYTPLLPDFLQICFLLGFTLTAVALIVAGFITLSSNNREVKIYFLDILNKLRGRGAFSHTVEEAPELATKVQSMKRRKWRIRGIVNRRKQRRNSGGTDYVRDVFHCLPSHSEHNNFKKNRNIIRVHLAFAHDLISFIAMADGRI